MTSRKRKADASSSTHASKVSKPSVEELVGEARGTPFAPAPKDEHRLTSDTIAKALQHLKQDPDLAWIINKLGDDTSSLWNDAGRSADGSVDSLSQFLCLAETRLRSRITVKLANALLQEVKEACGGTVTPATLVANAAPLRLLLVGKFQGQQKFDALQSLAEHWQEMPDYNSMSSKDALATLSKINGFGEATILTFLVKALARVDVLVESDGLVKAWLDRQKGVSKDGTNAQAMHERLLATVNWKPWRSIGCLLIWSEKEDSHAGLATVLG